MQGVPKQCQDLVTLDNYGTWRKKVIVNGRRYGYGYGYGYGRN